QRRTTIDRTNVRSWGTLSERISTMNSFPPCKLNRGALIKRKLSRILISFVLRLRRAADVPIAFCSPNDTIGTEIFAWGTFEEEYLLMVGNLLRDRLNSAPTRSKSAVALDVGANIGTHALFFSGLVDKVLAFEPNPAAFLVCQANALSSGTTNVQVFEVA